MREEIIAYTRVFFGLSCIENPACRTAFLFIHNAFITAYTHDDYTQANALARHLVLQKYQQTAIGGGAVGAGIAGGRFGSLPWNVSRSGVDGGENDCDDQSETPVVLSARVEAVELLLKAVPIARPRRVDVEREEREMSAATTATAAGVVVADDTAREQSCWFLLLEARKAYSEWASARRAREQRGGQQGHRFGAEAIGRQAG